MRTRLRPKYSDEQLAEIYATPHNHEKWVDHKVRVKQTIAVGAPFAWEMRSIADLSTGDAAIPKGLSALASSPVDAFLGDYAEGHHFVGPIEKTIEEIPKVDVFVLSETLEHLDDPDTVLKQIRAKTNALIMSTPLAEPDDSNPEHYWSWDNHDIRAMLVEAGFQPHIYSCVQFEYLGGYGFQIWGCW